MKEHTVVRNNKLFTVHIFDNGVCSVYEQAINPKTGKGWQAKRNMQHFEGSLAVNKAMVAWMNAARGK